jgi:hypothetical protein
MSGIDPAEDIPALYERHAVVWDASRSKNLFERRGLDRFGRLLPEGAARSSISAAVPASHLHRISSKAAMA